MWDKFVITDGTKPGTIDILAMLYEWYPQLPPTKGGGSWSGSSYMQGRQLFDKQLDNIIDTFVLNIVSGSKPETTLIINKITTLLDKGVSYWLNNYQTDMVWLDMRLSCNTFNQYSLINDWNILELNDYFSAPFGVNGTMEQVTLTIEHGVWTENEPGTGTAIELQSGNTNIEQTTAEKAVWVSNYWKDAPLTHVYVYDTTGPAWSANLAGVDVATLFPAVPAAGDILYVGRTSVAPGSAFDNLIWNIGTAENDLDMVIEMWDGAAWTTFAAAGYNIQDDTTTFDNTGRNCMTFDPPWTGNVWTPVAINGVTAYWVRFRITAIGAAPSPPITAEAVYTNEWPYYDIPADQILGTYPALGRSVNYRRDNSFIDEDTAQQNALTSSLILGLRSLDRGEDFIAFLPTYNNQLPVDFTYTIISAVASQQASNNAPSGYYTLWNPAGAATEDVAYWIILDPTARTYSGTYRLFMRGREVGASRNIRNQIRVSTGNVANVVYSSPWKYNVANNDEVVDFGVITIPDTHNFPTYSNTIYIIIYGDATANTSDYYYYDLILMPVDELSAEIKIPAGADPLEQKVFYNDKQLVVDSISEPKYQVQSTLLYDNGLGSQIVFTNWMSIITGNYKYGANSVSGQRLWHLQIFDENYDGSASPLNRAIFHPLFTSIATKNQQYKSLRGD